MPNPYHDKLGRFTTGPHSGVKHSAGLAIASAFKGGGASAQAHGGKFGKVSQRMPNGIEVKPIYARNKDGSIKMSKSKLNKKTGKWSKPKPVLDKIATWNSIPDAVLDENLRQAMRQAKPWAVEAGKEWYPGARRLSSQLTKKYAAKFKKDHGIELSAPVAAGIISCFSRNNGWIRNIVGVRQYFDDPERLSPKKKDGKTTMVKPMHITMKGGVNDLLAFVKKRHAAGDSNDKKIVDDFFAQYSTAPKPHNFYKSIMGDEQNGTIDRWMTRIMLHTDDSSFAGSMVGAGASRTLKNADGSKRKVEVNYGFSRMRASMLRVAREPEFRGLTPIQMQAIAWVHLVGPVGSVGYISDLSSDSAAKAEILSTADKRKWAG